MRRSLLLLAAGALLATRAGAAAPGPRRRLDEGRAAYGRGEYEAAAKAFAEAARSAPGAKLDPSVARHNEASALFRQRRLEDAANAFGDAARTGDRRAQAQAYYGRGRVLNEAAQAAGGGADPREGIRRLDEALAMYETAILLDPRDRDAKANYELTVRRREELQRAAEQPAQPQPAPQPGDGEGEPQPRPQDPPQPGEPPPDAPPEPSPGDPPQTPSPQDPSSQNPSPEGAGDGQAGGQPERAEAMTPEEARVLLDALRQEEEASRDRMRLRLGEPVPVERDW